MIATSTYGGAGSFVEGEEKWAAASCGFYSIGVPVAFFAER
jgi:hypothetical protein